ncbi:MAG: PLP-dependent aminotransferase family protein [Chloroflexi bacterium]|nr:PLP-dependent aminotransferase family protein [Chloroflexota bacterium]
MGSAIQFNFGPGNPDPGVFPSRDLAAAAQRVIERSGTELAHYPDQRGLPALRELLQARFEHSHGVRPPVDHIVMTNGAMQGLQLAAQALARPGDPVILEEFEYGGTIRVFKQHGLRLVGAPLDDHGMIVDALPALIEQHKPAFIYTTASYQNPTGTSLPRERREQLVSIARRYHLPIVEDDTYADISFEPQLEKAVYALAEPGEVMYIASLSKILGPGLRLGYFIAPEPLLGRIMPWKTDGGTSALSQMIAAEYFSENLWTHMLDAANAVKEKRNVLLDALETEFSGLAMHWTRPDGGLFLWVRLPPEVDRVRLFELAQARGIQYSTGQAFHSGGEDVPYLRLAFGWIEKDKIAEGVRQLAECLRVAMPATAAAR